MHRYLRRILAVAAVATAVIFTANLGLAYAAPSSVPSGTSAQLYRETVILDDRDTGTTPEAMKHVTELQLRLIRAGQNPGPVDGDDGPRTTTALRSWQQLNGLPASGIADQVVWSKLIASTTTNLSEAVKRCGGHATGVYTCVDKTNHQAVVFRGGVLWNAYLVRTGGQVCQEQYLNGGQPYNCETDAVTSKPVFFRSIDHHSTILRQAYMPFAQFYNGGEALHASPLMINPYVGNSHGCVNMYFDDAIALWNLTEGTKHYVSVY